MSHKLKWTKESPTHAMVRRHWYLLCTLRSQNDTPKLSYVTRHVTVGGAWAMRILVPRFYFIQGEGPREVLLLYGSHFVEILSGYLFVIVAWSVRLFCCWEA